ncbi:MAG: hypothetical protein Q7P63_00800 [Verrucomicrobiota bacterium JB022]|nr:hypothetical protein [Verrucomicrobiota bacterium JB022]
MVYSSDERRHRAGLQLLHSGEEVRVGTTVRIPLPYAELEKLTTAHRFVIGHMAQQTTEILRVAIGDLEYALKLWRREWTDPRMDEQLAFLTELEVRRRIEASREIHYSPDTPMQYLVKSIFGSLNHNVLVSPWIVGSTLWHVPTRQWSDKLLDSFFAAQLFLCRLGVFDWNPSPGNILVDEQDGTARLFDFGHAYFFDACVEYNSSGLERPDVHPAERFETRTLFPCLLKGGQDLLSQTSRQLWRRSKQAAIPHYFRLSEKLHGIGAQRTFVRHYRDHALAWKEALANPAEEDRLYLRELYRSLVYDVEHALHQQYWTPLASRQLEVILGLLEEHFPELQEAGFLVAADADQSQTRLIAKYQRARQAVHELQLSLSA